MNYYNNKKYYHDGMQFRSTDEVHFWNYCKRRQAEEIIQSFEYEPEKFELISKFRFQGKSYQAMTYTPDFKIYYPDGFIEYVEVKGHLTNEAKLKNKLFRWHLSNNNPKAGYIILSRSLKYGNIDNEWIEYEELQKLRKKNKKK